MRRWQVQEAVGVLLGFGPISLHEAFENTEARDQYLPPHLAHSGAHQGKRLIGDDGQAAQALFRFARMFGPPVRQVLSGSNAKGIELARMLVVQALGTLGSAQATVEAVAQQLDFDPSTASRLVAETIREGYAMRKPPQEDGRCSVLELTDVGWQLAEVARTYQQSVSERATRRWTLQERETFARLFVTLMQAAADFRDEAGVVERVRQP